MSTIEFNNGATVLTRDSFVKSVQDVLRASSGVPQELSFMIPADIPLIEMLDILTAEEAQKEFGKFRVTAIGGELRIRQQPLETHEAAASLLDELRTALSNLGGTSPKLKRIGTTRYVDGNTAKEADGGVRPDSRVLGELPSVVIEVGDGQALERDVDEWFGMNPNSPDRIKLVITVEIHRSSRRVVLTFFQRASQRSATCPHLAVPVPNVGPFEWVADDLLPTNIINIPGITLPMDLFYDTVPPALALHATIALPATTVQDWLQYVYEGL